MNATNVGFYSRIVSIGAQARGWGTAAPPIDSGKTIIFRAKDKFFGQKPAAENGKSVFIKQKNGIHSVERDKVTEIRDFYSSRATFLT